MQDAAINFLVEKYKLDEMKARAIIAFYQAYTDQEIATVPGQLTEEELLLLQQQQQQQGQPGTVQVPQQFGAGGGPLPPGPSPEEVKPSWWEAVWPWGYMQSWQVAEPFVWPASIISSGGAGAYYGGRALGAYGASLPLRAAGPSGNILGRLAQGVPTRQLVAARLNPQFAEQLAQWYAGKRVGTQPSLTQQQVRQAQYLTSPAGRNLLQRTTSLRFPQSSISLLTEAEIMAAESNPAVAQRFRSWFNRGAPIATKPTIPVLRGSLAGTTFQRAGWLQQRGIFSPRIAQPQQAITYGRPTAGTQIGVRPTAGWPATTGPRTPGQSNIPGQTYRNWLRTRGGTGGTGGRVGSGLNIPAAGTTGFWGRALGGLVSGLSLIGTAEAFRTVGGYFGAPTGGPSGGGEIPEPHPFQWGPGTEQGGTQGKCATGHKFHAGYGSTVSPGCYTTAEHKRIEKAIKEIEIQQGLGFGPAL